MDKQQQSTHVLRSNPTQKLSELNDKITKLVNKRINSLQHEHKFLETQLNQPIKNMINQVDINRVIRNIDFVLAINSNVSNPSTNIAIDKIDPKLYPNLSYLNQHIYSTNSTSTYPSRNTYSSLLGWHHKTLELLRRDLTQQKVSVFQCLQSQNMLLLTLLQNFSQQLAKQCVDKAHIMNVCIQQHKNLYHGLLQYMDDKIKYNLKERVENQSKIENQYMQEIDILNKQLKSLGYQKDRKWKNLFMLIKDNRILRRTRGKLLRQVQSSFHKQKLLKQSIVQLTKQNQRYKLLLHSAQYQHKGLQKWLKNLSSLVKIQRYIQKQPLKAKRVLEFQLQNLQINQMQALPEKIQYVIKAIQEAQELVDYYEDFNDLAIPCKLLLNNYTQTQVQYEDHSTNTNTYSQLNSYCQTKLQDFIQNNLWIEKAYSLTHPHPDSKQASTQKKKKASIFSNYMQQSTINKRKISSISVYSMSNTKSQKGYRAYLRIVKSVQETIVPRYIPLSMSNNHYNYHRSNTQTINNVNYTLNSNNGGKMVNLSNGGSYVYMDTKFLYKLSIYHKQVNIAVKGLQGFLNSIYNPNPDSASKPKSNPKKSTILNAQSLSQQNRQNVMPGRTSNVFTVDTSEMSDRDGELYAGGGGLGKGDLVGKYLGKGRQGRYSHVNNGRGSNSILLNKLKRISTMAKNQSRKSTRSKNQDQSYIHSNNKSQAQVQSCSQSFTQRYSINSEQKSSNLNENSTLNQNANIILYNDIDQQIISQEHSYISDNSQRTFKGQQEKKDGFGSIRVRTEGSQQLSTVNVRVSAISKSINTKINNKLSRSSQRPTTLPTKQRNSKRQSTTKNPKMSRSSQKVQSYNIYNSINKESKKRMDVQKKSNDSMTQQKNIEYNNQILQYQQQSSQQSDSATDHGSIYTLNGSLDTNYQNGKVIKERLLGAGLNTKNSKSNRTPRKKHSQQEFPIKKIRYGQMIQPQNPKYRKNSQNLGLGNTQPATIQKGPRKSNMIGMSNNRNNVLPVPIQEQEGMQDEGFMAALGQADSVYLDDQANNNGKSYTTLKRISRANKHYATALPNLQGSSQYALQNCSKTAINNYKYFQAQQLNNASHSSAVDPSKLIPKIVHILYMSRFQLLKSPTKTLKQCIQSNLKNIYGISPQQSSTQSLQFSHFQAFNRLLSLEVEPSPLLESFRKMLNYQTPLAYQNDLLRLYLMIMDKSGSQTMIVDLDRAKWVINSICTIFYHHQDLQAASDQILKVLVLLSMALFGKSSKKIKNKVNNINKIANLPINLNYYFLIIQADLRQNCLQTQFYKFCTQILPQNQTDLTFQQMSQLLKFLPTDTEQQIHMSRLKYYLTKQRDHTSQRTYSSPTLAHQSLSKPTTTSNSMKIHKISMYLAREKWFSVLNIMTTVQNKFKNTMMSYLSDQQLVELLSKLDNRQFGQSHTRKHCAWIYSIAKHMINSYKDYLSIPTPKPHYQPHSQSHSQSHKSTRNLQPSPVFSTQTSCHHRLNKTLLKLIWLIEVEFRMQSYGLLWKNLDIIGQVTRKSVAGRDLDLFLAGGKSNGANSTNNVMVPSHTNIKQKDKQIQRDKQNIKQILKQKDKQYTLPIPFCDRRKQKLESINLGVSKQKQAQASNMPSNRNLHNMSSTHPNESQANPAVISTKHINPATTIPPVIKQNSNRSLNSNKILTFPKIGSLNNFDGYSINVNNIGVDDRPDVPQRRLPDAVQDQVMDYSNDRA